MACQRTLGLAKVGAEQEAALSITALFTRYEPRCFAHSKGHAVPFLRHGLSFALVWVSAYSVRLHQYAWSFTTYSYGTIACLSNTLRQPRHAVGRQCSTPMPY